jgi:hypothetical protein
MQGEQKSAQPHENKKIRRRVVKCCKSMQIETLGAKDTLQASFVGVLKPDTRTLTPGACTFDSRMATGGIVK